MKELSILPDGYAEILRVYGDPLSRYFVSDRLKSFELPFTMRASWNTSIKYKWMTMHRLIGDVVVDALEEIRDHNGYNYLREECYDIIGGCYNLRKKTSSDQLSTHSWGIAVDICPHLGPFGKRPQMPVFIVEAFEKRGFVWGGRWKLPDGMHFQACKGY